MNKLIDFIHQIYILRDLERYNNTMRIKSESVAEHSAFVTLIVLKLYEEYTFDLQKALIMAITHDVPEVLITDVPHNVKRRFPKVKEAVKNEEVAIFDSIFPQYTKLFKDLEEDTTVEAKIVVLADILSCVQYSTSEVKLGNIGYMSKVLQESEDRAKILTDELKEFKL